MARRRRRRRRILGRALLLVIGFAALLGVIYFILVNRFLVVRSINVELPEDCRFTPQQAVQLTGIELGTRLDRVDEAAVEQNILNTGWLKLENIEVNYPNSVQVTLSQRRPAALVSHVSTLLVTDADGVMIEQVTGEPGYPDCVYITDVDIRRAQPGQALQAASSDKTEAIVALLQGFEQVPCHELISWVSLEEPRNIRMYSTNHVWVEMGDSSRIPDKLRWAEAALNDMISRDESLGTLNVSSGNHADYAPGE